MSFRTHNLKKIVTTDSGKLTKAMLKGRRPTNSNDAMDVIIVRRTVKFMTLISV